MRAKVLVSVSFPEKCHRYEAAGVESAGDYWAVPEGLHFQIADTGNDQYNRIVLIHELVEQLLTEAKGIPEPEIMAFDLAHPELTDPGDDPAAPYHAEHSIALAVERLICAYIGQPWKAYDEIVTGEAKG